jgi:cell division FtsZ-interacting protein ZapD
MGHDLIWTSQVALLGTLKSELLRGLHGARYHLTHLGLAAQEPTLDSLINEVQTVSETAMSREWRNGVSGKVSRFVTEVGKLAAKNQPDFEKDVT